MKKIIFATMLFMAPFTAQASTSSLTKDRMQSNLDVIEQTFAVKYAPADWKKEYTDWELLREIQNAKVAIEEADTVTTKDYQRLIKKFFLSTKDYHVGVQFYSTEYSFLPFRLQSSGDRYFIAETNEEMYSFFNQKPIQIGDEILEFNGKPIHEVVTEYMKQEFGNWDSRTDKALAEMTFSARSGEIGDLCPSGMFSITIKEKLTGEVSSRNLFWIHHEEEVPELPESIRTFEATCAKFDKTKPLSEHPHFQRNFTTPLYQPIQNTLAKQETKTKMGGIFSQEGFLPDLGRKVWENSSYYGFRAYIYEKEDGTRVGFIRIDSYMKQAYQAEQFASIINRFERETDVLVIDQLNNPGGSLFYMYALASMLTDQPLPAPKHEMTITQEDVFWGLNDIDALEWIQSDEDAKNSIGSTIGGYPVDYDVAQSMLAYTHFIIDEWSEGRVITNPYPVMGIEYIKPHPRANYTKPILMLINNLDFSCGDMMPAILQDSGRVTLMGSQTAGAGGYVLGHEFPNWFGIAEYSFTGSIAERKDGSRIENLGVKPDIRYEISVKDLQEDYVDFVNAINAAVDQIK